jgi:hypothetical protein
MRTATLITTVLAPRFVPTAIPTAPSITSPSAGQVFDTTEPTFTWTASLSTVTPITYGYEVATDAGMTSVIHSASDLSTLNDTASPALENHQPVLYIRVSATNATTTTYSAVVAFAVSAFTQTISADPVNLNPNFTDWTGAAADNWTLSPGTYGGDPGVSQVDPSGAEGEGAAHLVGTADFDVIMYQDVLETGNFYETNHYFTHYDGAGVVALYFGSRAVLVMVGNVRPNRITGYADGERLAMRGLSTPLGATLDYVRIHLITPNTAIAKVADGTHEFRFTINGDAPINHQAAEIRYRWQNATNFWQARVHYAKSTEDWTFHLNRVVNNVFTNQITAAGIGTMPDAIRVVTSGNNHTCYTVKDGVATQRGAVITSATGAAQTNVVAFYNTGMIPLQLSSV